MSGPLAPRHLEDLKASGVSPETALAAGARSADACEVAAILGFDAGPGLVFPYHGTDVPGGGPFQRVKPDRPRIDEDGNVAKYLSPKRQLNPAGNRLYVPQRLERGILRDPSCLLIVTEGEKKTLAALQAGLATIGLPGVWCFRKREDEDSRPIDDLASIVWTGRPVAIAFDSDAATNEGVKAAERALVQELRRRGAQPFVVRLPEPRPEETERHGTKFGLDDFILARGVERLRELIDEAQVRLPLGAKSVSQLLAEPIRPERWLIDGIWPRRGVGFFAGEPKSFKSLHSDWLAICVACGIPFYGRDVAQGPVVIVDEEADRDELKLRIQKTAAGLGVDPKGIQNIYIAEPGLLRLDDQRAVDDLDALVERVKPAVVILDPLVRLHGGDENDVRVISPMLGHLRQLQQRRDCAVVVVHHLRKKNETRASLGQRMRGTSDLHGWFDAAVFLERLSDTATRVSFETRYGKRADSFVATLDDADGSYRWQIGSEPSDPARRGTGRDAEVRRVVEALREHADGLTRDELRAATGLSDRPLRNTIRELQLQDRVVERVGPSGGGRRPRVIVLMGPEGTRSSSPPPKGGGDDEEEVGGLVRFEGTSSSPQRPPIRGAKKKTGPAEATS